MTQVNQLYRIESWFGGLEVAICCLCEKYVDILSGDPPLCECPWHWSRFIPNERKIEEIEWNISPEN